MNSFLVCHNELNRFSPSQHPSEKALFAGLKEEGGSVPRPGSPRTKPSRFVLAAAVLTAASLLAPFARAATDYLMPTTPFDPNPATPGSLTSKVLTYGVDSDTNHVPLKTLRITNNTAHTVYPILRDPNSATTAIKEGRVTVGLYDPYDKPNMEYRGYIGYSADGKYYFGLKPGQSILVSVPLVFWNGARIGVGTDGQYLTPSALPNPENWDAKGQRSIAGAETSGDTIPNGVVMWYRADIAQGPADDTEDQLAEWTIRDHGYLVNPQITAKTYNEIPDGQLVTLMNWDVSNVDTLYLPLALEANDVWVVPQRSGPGPNGSRNDWSPGSDPDVTGWTGATNTIEFLQDKIKEFTAGNQLLGQYFGTKGWPHYNIPNPTNDPNAPVKIPGGANIYAESPLKGTLNSYANGTWQSIKYLLSSGGSAPVKVGIGWAGGTPDPVGSTIVHLTIDTPLEIAFVKKGYLVHGHPAAPLPDPIQDGTTVLDVDKTAATVTLSKPLVHPSTNTTFEFIRPVDDYASDAMIKLWYSWAQYYLKHWKDKTPSAPTAPTTIRGSIHAMTATLTFKEAHPELVKGMAVKGPGLDNAETEVGLHQGDAVILTIASDKKSVILSQVVAIASTDATFTFLPPQSLLWTPTAEGDPGYPLIGDQFQFSGEPAWNDPYKFSQVVYLIMASMNQIGKPNNGFVSKYMQDIVGANMGYIFTDAAKKSYDANLVTSMIRDMIKSVLRGVSDFTKYPDVIDNQGNHTSWYPDPAKRTGGQLFNVFNLDPYVRFIHVNLGFSGYGFSVDDDTADVGGGGPSHLQLTVTGTGGLNNTNQWTIQAPYGPVTNVSLMYSGPASSTNGDTLYNAIASVSNTTPIVVTSKEPLPVPLSNGDTVVIDQVNPLDNAANGTFKIGNLTRNTFALFDAVTGKTPIPGNGPSTADTGRWSYPLHPYIDSGADLTKVFYRVTGDDALGTFLGTFVSVNGVDQNKTNGVKFRVWQLGRQDKGRLLLWADLTDAFGTPLSAGTYTFTFFGVAPTGIAQPLQP